MPYSYYDPDDPDAPQPEDIRDQDEDLEEETIACPACGRDVHELASVCPHCGGWILDDSPDRRRSVGWFWPVMVALLIAIMLVFWHGL